MPLSAEPRPASKILNKPTGINVEATAHLAHLSKDIPFIFLSSGEVFDGKAGWYGETDEPNPINVYGQTKLEAEQAVLQNPRHTVVRIVLTAGTSETGDRGFVEDMCRTAKAGRDVTLYADEFRCPLPAGVIARVIWELVDRKQPGLYHLGGSERLSRWDIGEALLPWYPELERSSDDRLRTEPRWRPPARRPLAPLRQDPASPVISHSRVS